MKEQKEQKKQKKDNKEMKRDYELASIKCH